MKGCVIKTINILITRVLLLSLLHSPRRLLRMLISIKIKVTIPISSPVRNTKANLNFLTTIIFSQTFSAERVQVFQILMMTSKNLKCGKKKIRKNVKSKGHKTLEINSITEIEARMQGARPENGAFAIHVRSKLLQRGLNQNMG